ncbi:MAG: helix-turn-helix transcriptional regulator [bacterium]|nr:helix-turn-helix transcriptional regulator [bacterium]
MTHTPPDDQLESISLAQAKALANPLRRRMLSAFRAAERSPFQLAKDLGEPPTKLYHHVRILLEADLIVPTRTEKKRGAKEQFYIARAQEFHLKAKGTEATMPLFESALSIGLSELNKNLASQQDNAHATCTYLSASTKVYADADALREFAEFTAAWIKLNRTPAPDKQSTFIAVATFPVKDDD